MAEEIKDKFFILTIFLILFHVISNTVWLSLNGIPPSDDAAFHTTLSMRFIDYFQHHLTEFNFHTFLAISPFYPPFTHIVGAIIGFVDPYNYKIIQITGTLFFSLAMIFLFLYTKEKTKNGFVSFLSVFFFSFFIYIFKYSHDHMSDIPLIAAFLAGVYFLELSRSFKNFKNTIIFFICLSIAFLIRWTALIFFLIPLFFQTKSILQSLLISKKARIGFLLGIIIFVFSVLPWYITNFETVIEVGKTASMANINNPTNVFSLESILFYLKLIIMFQISFLGFVLLCISFIPNIKNMKRKFFFEIIFTIIFGYIIFTFFLGNKNIRYIFAIMPFFAILLGNGAYLFFTKYRFASPIVMIVMTYYFISYFILSFGFPFYPQYKYAFNFPVLGWTDVYYWHNYPVNVLFDKTDWKNNELALALNSAKKKDKTIFYYIGSLRLYLNDSTVHLFLYRINQGVSPSLQEINTNLFQIAKGNSKFASIKDIDNYVNSIDILFIPEKEIGPEQAIRDLVLRKQIQEYMLKNANPNFVKTQTISLPDGDRINVYKKLSILNPN